MKRRIASLFAAALVFTTGIAAAEAAAKKEFNVAWSIYVGWMPWPYAVDAGIVKRWADKYGITINVTQINDYVESINQYTAGKFDGVTVTNMDALTIPAAGGVDSSAIIMGDFSNGNDGIVLKDGASLADIKGRPINIVEFSVSQYLLARGLASVGLTEKDVKTVNTSDVDIVAAFKAPESVAVVTWNPQLMEVKAEPKATEVFDSSKSTLPGAAPPVSYSHVDRFRARFGQTSAEFLVISPGKACNLRCRGCYANSGAHREKLDWGTFERTVRDAHDDWGVRVFVISGGEPLAWRDGGRSVLDLA